MKRYPAQPSRAATTAARRRARRRPIPQPATPSPSGSTPPPLVACPRGDPDARQPYPTDGRIHGGGLSFPEQPGWDPSRLRTGLTWAYDVNGQDKTIEPEWFAMFAVGALSVVDGFEVPAQAAESVMQCTATSDYYRGFTGRKDLHSKAVTVAGRPGWSIRAEISCRQRTHRAARRRGRGRRRRLRRPRGAGHVLGSGADRRSGHDQPAGPGGQPAAGRASRSRRGVLAR